MDLSPKKRGYGLATCGLVLAIGVLALLNAIHFVEVTQGEWAVLALIALLTAGGSWLLLLRGSPLWASWDPHFVVVPSAGVVILFSGLVWAGDEARLLILIVWPVVLIFLAGYVGFLESALLSALMTAGYLTAVALASPGDVRLEFEVILTTVFLISNLFGGTVLARIRRQRSDLAAARAELARLVNTDPLTGLPNRRRFDEVYASEIARTIRYRTAFSLALLDIDRFKEYNDRLGHPAGDDALRELAALMEEELRSNDLIARLGGEEFARGPVRSRRGCRAGAGRAAARAGG